MPEKLPPVRESEDSIEIDQKKGQWPYARFVRLEEGELGIILDSNQGGIIIGEGVGQAALVISKKKARRLREFLERTEL